MKLKNTQAATLLSLAVFFCAASCKKSDPAVTPAATPAQTTVAGASTSNLRTQAVGAWQRVLTDDFTNSGSLNNWSVTNRADYNSSICLYQPGNVSFGTYDSRNVLVLTANKNGSSYNSGHIKSNFSFKPANNEEWRVSSQIKLIAIDGSTYKDFTQTYGAWPAFWTVQETNWPTKGEIDIMEGYSFSTYARFASNLFYGNSTGNNQLGNTCEKPYGVSAGWHMYDEYWKNQNGAVTVTIQLDGVTVTTYTNAINGNLALQNFGPHNIIFNLAVGSNSNVGIFNNASINLFSKTMMWVDYVTIDKRTL